MDDKELKEILEQLEAQGWNPRVCDVAVPVITSAVPCGEPTMLGDEGVEEWRLWPKELLKEIRAVVIRIKGNSMINAGLVDGDEVLVEITSSVSDGDVVAVMLNNESTVKMLAHDEDGNLWLVPANDDFDAIAVDDDMDLLIAGVVTRVMKRAPRQPFSELMRSINRTRRKQTSTGRPKGKQMGSLFTETCTAEQRERLYDAIRGQRGKDAVLLLKMACEAEWLTEMPSYADAKKVFGNIGAKSNYYDYRDLAMTEEEITWAKLQLTI